MPLPNNSMSITSSGNQSPRNPLLSPFELVMLYMNDRDRRTFSDQIDVLNSQLTALRFGSQGDPDELREPVTQAQEQLDDAEADLALKYSTNVISMVKTCYASDGALDEGQVAGLFESGDLVGVALDNLISDMQATNNDSKNIFPMRQFKTDIFRTVQSLGLVSLGIL